MRDDSGELVVLDGRGAHRPVVGALVGASKEGILAVEGKRANGELYGVAVEIDATIFRLSDKSIPARKRVAERLATSRR